MAKFFIIDGNSLINRAFYATPPLTNSEGQMTNAVYAFTNILIKLIGDFSPQYLAVAFDKKAKTFRHELYEGYKASRKGMPDELASQLPLLKELLGAMNIATLEEEGFEADDIIGALAKRFDCQTAIITGDRDALQLIDDNIKVMLTKKGLTEIDVVDKNNIVEKFGLTPEQVVDFKALCGDASDEIPGVKGIGEKTAKALLGKYGSLDNVYANIDGIEGAVKNKLAEGRESAYLSKKLAQLSFDCDCNYDLENFVFKYPFDQKVTDVFKKLGFNKLLQKEHLFENSAENLPAAAMKEVPAEYVEGENQLAELVNSISGEIAVYFGENINICDGEKEYIIKISDTFLPDALTMGKALEILKPLLENEKIAKTVFDLKNIFYLLKPYGCEIKGVCDDVCIMNYIASAGAAAYDFKKIAAQEGYGGENYAFALSDLRQRLLKKLENDGQLALYREIEFPLIFILYDMEQTGFKVDVNALEELSQRYSREIEEVTKNIYLLAGETFNISSPKQLGDVLFNKLGLRASKKTKSGFSTDVEVLESLYGKHPVIPLIIRYRMLTKLKSTYIDGIRNMLDTGGVVHTVFKQAQTSTGRISSVEPNLQNIPIREEEGREIRKIFIPSSPDNVLVSADYSQIELRLLAHFSEDEKLIEAYNRHADIHTITAAKVFNVAPESVTPAMRRSAKAVNFGIIYGISPYGLANQLKILPSVAKVYIEKYFETYPAVESYLNGSVEFAKKHGYSLTVTGRKRFIPELKSPNFYVRGFGERAAKNMPLQGSAADLVKIAMINVYNAFKDKKLKAKIILQVHDEIIVDAPGAEKETVKEILKTEMENVMRLKVPLEVGVSEGSNWFDAK
jgi:DNA polymerase-1